MRNPMAQPNKNFGIFQDPLPRHNNNIKNISSKATHYANHDYNHRYSNEFVGFNDIDSNFPFVGGIDIIPHYEFMGVMELPPSYHIIEVHNINMVNVTK